MSLSNRQQQIMQRLCAGENQKEIAAALSISVETVKIYIDRVKSRMSVRSTLAAVALFSSLQVSPKTVTPKRGTRRK